MPLFQFTGSANNKIKTVNAAVSVYSLFQFRGGLTELINCKLEQRPTMFLMSYVSMYILGFEFPGSCCFSLWRRPENK